MTACLVEDFGCVCARGDAFRSGNATRAESYLRDGTLQYYTVTVPVGYDPAKSRDKQKRFPLFLELHGAGNTHPLNGPSAYYGNTPNSGNGYDTATTYACQARVGYHLFPFARGNSGYRDIGETDLWEAIADFDATFKADPDRRDVRRRERRSARVCSPMPASGPASPAAARPAKPPSWPRNRVVSE